MSVPAAAPATTLALVATPGATTSTQQPVVDADLVTPGLGGFASLFLLALAVYFLGRSMTRRVRRVEQRARFEAERAAAATAARPPAEGPAGPGSGEHPGGDDDSRR